MREAAGHRTATVVLAAVGALIGLVVAAIVTLNLHIVVGLEQGYAASPAEVFEHSIALGIFDVVLAVAAPVGGALGMLWLRRRGVPGDGR
jgi:hypothetical protein